MLALVWAIGDWLPWTRTVYTIGRAGYTFPATHSNTRKRLLSGYAFGSNFTFLQKVQTAVFMALLLIGSVVLAFLLPRKVPGIALMALGALYLSDTIVWLYQLAHPPSYPATEKQLRFFHLSTSVTGLPGGWIAAAAAIALVLLGLFRFLSSYVGSDAV